MDTKDHEINCVATPCPLHDLVDGSRPLSGRSTDWCLGTVFCITEGGSSTKARFSRIIPMLHRAAVFFWLAVVIEIIGQTLQVFLGLIGDAM